MPELRVRWGTLLILRGTYCKLGKRVLVYVHDDTWNFYEVWRKNRDAFKTSAPQGLDEATLQMFHELKSRQGGQWRYLEIARARQDGIDTTRRPS
jgi:hypothetical protein